MKIALVHDQLQEFGGAERVLVALKKTFPQADVFTSLYDAKKLGAHAKEFSSWKIKKSWAHYVPFFKKFYSPLRFLAPNIWESFDFTGYDVVISSSGWYMSKGIKTQPPTVHICYLHHPPRYLYNYETAVEWQKYWPIKIYAHIVNHKLRMWDYLTSQSVDYFVANSQETKRRIKKLYRKDAQVIYPPVKIPKQIRNAKSEMRNYYITVSRLGRAKYVDVLIAAANKLKIPLKIVGTGRDEEYLKSISGSTVEFLGNIADEELEQLYTNARVFLFASVDEEFGIAPVEAMSYGVPVIAFKSGGLIETVQDGVNGYLFDKLSSESLAVKIKQLESLSKNEYLQMRKNARMISEDFSEQKFQKRITDFVVNKLSSRTK